MTTKVFCDKCHTEITKDKGVRLSMSSLGFLDGISVDYNQTLCLPCIGISNPEKPAKVVLAISIPIEYTGTRPHIWD